MSTFREALVSLIICTMALLANGCFWIGDEAAPSYQQLEKKLGNAKAITAWTVEQKNAAAIQDGATALADITASQRGHESHEALAGFVSVVKKLETGWPGLMVTVWNGDKQQLVPIDSLPLEEQKKQYLLNMKNCYYQMAETAINQYKWGWLKDGPLAIEGLKQVKPEENNVELFIIWTKEWDRVQREISLHPNHSPPI